MEEMVIRVRLLEHGATGLLVAVSDDLPGLAVHGSTVEDIEERLPGLIKDLLDANGIRVSGVSLARNEVPNYGPPGFTANASRLEAA